MTKQLNVHIINCILYFIFCTLYLQFYYSFTFYLEFYLLLYVCYIVIFYLTLSTRFSCDGTDHEQMLQKGATADQFVLQHFQGTNPVVYSAQGWLRASRENPVLRQAPTVLQESKK